MELTWGERQIDNINNGRSKNRSIWFKWNTLYAWIICRIKNPNHSCQMQNWPRMHLNKAEWNLFDCVREYSTCNVAASWLHALLTALYWHLSWLLKPLQSKHKTLLFQPNVLCTVALMLQCCVCLSPSVVCTKCIMAKRRVLEQKLLLRTYRKTYMRNRLVPNEWPWPLFRGRITVMWTIALHSPLNISEIVRDRGLVPKDHQ